MWGRDKHHLTASAGFTCGAFCTQEMSLDLSARWPGHSHRFIGSASSWCRVLFLYVVVGAAVL